MRKLARTDDYLAFRLDEGTDFFPAVKALLVGEDVTTAVLVAAAGMMRHVEIGWNGGGGDYLKKTFDDPLEILGLSGTVSRKPNGDPYFHAHATFGDSEHRAWGGHLFRATVHETCEIVFALPREMTFYRMPLAPDELPRFCPERSSRR